MIVTRRKKYCLISVFIRTIGANILIIIKKANFYTVLMHYCILPSDGLNLPESIWDLRTGKMVYSSHANVVGLFVRLNGFSGRLYGYGLSGNRIIAAVNASDLLTAIPGLTPDDNSVLVEITLK